MELEDDLDERLREAARLVVDGEDEDLDELELQDELEELADKDGSENLDCGCGCGALVISIRPTRLYASTRCRSNAQFYRDMSTPEGRRKRAAAKRVVKARKKDRRVEVREVARAGRPSIEDVQRRLGLAEVRRV